MNNTITVFIFSVIKAVIMDQTQAKDLKTSAIDQHSHNGVCSNIKSSVLLYAGLQRKKQRIQFSNKYLFLNISHFFLHKLV